MVAPSVARLFAEALGEHPELHLVVVVPRVPDQDGAFAAAAAVRRAAGRRSRCAGGPGTDRVHVFDVENHAGTPVYVHAKVCVVDDVWASVGSDNFNRRSWTHDSELSSAVLDTTRDAREPRDPAGTGDGARVFARDLRLTLAREHLDLRRRRQPRTRPAGPRAVRRRRSTAAPRRWTPGTTAAGGDPGRPAGCARTAPSACRCSPGCGRRRSTGCSTTPTAGRCKLRLKQDF